MYGSGMSLGAVIGYLSDLNGDFLLPFTLENPHSYRGYYEDLGVEMDATRTSTVRDALAVLTGAEGQTFTGYKGGEYTMTENVDVYIADWGSTGEPVTRLWLDAVTAGARS